MTPTRILTAEDRKNRIYIAGPMTGLPGLNFDAFNAKAAELRALGWHVENPAEHGIQQGATWSDYLRHDLPRLLTCSTIYLLKGWAKSKGALLEFWNARILDDFAVISEDGSTLPQPLMYGIQEPDGSAYMDEGCVNTKAEELVQEVDGLNSQQDPEDGRYRLVALYTMPAPATVQTQALLEAEAALEVTLARLTERDPSHAIHATSEFKALEMVRNALAGIRPEVTLSQATRDVIAERARQIELGYDHEHDDAHCCNEIAAAAAVLLMPEAAREWDATSTSYGATLAQALLPSDWPIPDFGNDRRAQLVKGTAMGLAELERFDRAASQSLQASEPA